MTTPAQTPDLASRIQAVAQPSGQTAPSGPASLDARIADVAKNGVSTEPPPITPTDTSATAQQMAKEGVSNFKPGQGIPFGHTGMGMTSGDITPTQAEGGAAAIGATAGVTGLAEALPAVVPATLNGAKAITAWAVKNPIHAYLTFQILKELVPGFKKLTGIVKGAPTE